jgi:hypothetical protein
VLAPKERKASKAPPDLQDLLVLRDLKELLVLPVLPAPLAQTQN